MVIGGGDVAVDAAITAKLLGADQVDMICLEQAEEMPAFPHNIDDAKAAGIGIHPGWGPLHVEGDGKASGIIVRRCLSVFDSNHRFAPTFDDAETRLFEAHAIIFATAKRRSHPLCRRLTVEQPAHRGGQRHL